MQRIDEHRIRDEGRVNVALDIVTGAHRELQSADRAETVLHRIDAVHQIRHPGDVVLGRDDLEAWKLLEHTAEDEDGNRALDLMMEVRELEHQIDTVRVGAGAFASRQNMQRERYPEVLRRGP